jgi:hypothetical protein
MEMAREQQNAFHDRLRKSETLRKLEDNVNMGLKDRLMACEAKHRAMFVSTGHTSGMFWAQR